MHFVNKPTSEHAKELMIEYMQQISDNQQNKHESKNARYAAELEAVAINQADINELDMITREKQNARVN